MNYNQPGDGDLVQFNQDSAPALGIIRMDQPDDLRWWEAVYNQAVADEWWYDSPDEPAEESEVGVEESARQLREWCDRHVKPPAWVWHRFVELPEDEQDDENRWTLASSTEPRDGYWRGAVIELTDPEGNR